MVLRISFGGWRIIGDGCYTAVEDMLHVMMIRREISDWLGWLCMFKGETMISSLLLSLSSSPSPSPSPARGISAREWITST